MVSGARCKKGVRVQECKRRVYENNDLVSPPDYRGMRRCIAIVLASHCL